MSCTIKIDHLQIIVLGNVHYQLWPQFVGRATDATVRSLTCERSEAEM